MFQGVNFGRCGMAAVWLLASRVGETGTLRDGRRTGAEPDRMAGRGVTAELEHVTSSGH